MKREQEQITASGPTGLLLHFTTPHRLRAGSTSCLSDTEPTLEENRAISPRIAELSLTNARTSTPLILLYGEDTLLLETRRWILEGVGFAVQNTTDQEHAKRILSTQQVSALLLCHTLSFEDRRHILAAAHALRPRMRSLVLTASGHGYIASEHNMVCRDLDGPISLIGAVQETVQRRSSLP